MSRLPGEGFARSPLRRQRGDPVRQWLVVATGLAVGGLLAMGLTGDWRQPAALRLLTGKPEVATTASGQFALCAVSFSSSCVSDGDTLKVDGAVIRIVGIDAPETHPPRCESEAVLGVRAAARLAGWLSEGPFEIVAVGERPTDRYGRNLRDIRRNGRSVGDDLIAAGLARSYDGHARRSWC